jgi:cobalt-zinc-cadmium efflux system outer membrane protein
LGWPEIVALVDADPRVAAGQHRLAADRTGVDEAGAVPNPELGAAAGYGLARQGGESRVEWGLELTIPLGWIGERRAKMDAAGARARVSQAEVQVLRREVLSQLGDLFWSLVHQQERVASLDELSTQTSALAATVKQRADQGEIRPVEAIQVAVEAEKIGGELEVAREALGAARAQLATWLGLDSDRQLVAVADLSALPSPIATDRARDLAGRQHPQLAAAQRRVQSLEAAVKLEQKARIPSMALTGFAEHELDRRAYGLGLVVDLPIWNWNSAGIQRSRSELAAGQSQLEAARRELIAAAVEAQTRCRAGVTLARRYQERILPRAAEAARTIERTYQLGEATLLEVLDASRTLLQTRRELLAIQARAQANCTQLDLLIREDLP